MARKIFSHKKHIISISILLVLLISFISFIVVSYLNKSQEKSLEITENYNQLLIDFEKLTEDYDELKGNFDEKEGQEHSLTIDYEKNINDLEHDIEIKQENINELNDEIQQLENEIEQLKQVLNTKNSDTGEHQSSLTEQLAQLSEREFSTDIQADKKVFLTFDDGPTLLTPTVLDILAVADIPASFFVVGQRMENEPSIVKRAYNEGHMILPHSYSHDYAIYSTLETFYDDMSLVENAYEKVLDHPAPRIFRFPGGSSNHSSFDYGGEQFMPVLTIDVKEKDYTYVDWNVSSGDAGPNADDPEKMLQSIIDQSEGKDFIVLLFHDTRGNNTMLSILPEVISYYQENGYAFRSFRDITDEELNEMNNRLISNKPIIR